MVFGKQTFSRFMWGGSNNDNGGDSGGARGFPSSPSGPNNNRTTSATLPGPQPGTNILFRCRGTLYIEDAEVNNSFNQLTDHDTSFLLLTHGLAGYSIEVHKEEPPPGSGEVAEEVELQSPVLETMNLLYHHPTTSVQWLSLAFGQARRFCYRFTDDPQAVTAGVCPSAGTISEKFVEVYNRALYAQCTGSGSGGESSSASSSSGRNRNRQQEDDVDDEEYAYVTAPFTAQASNIRASAPAAGATAGSTRPGAAAASPASAQPDDYDYGYNGGHRETSPSLFSDVRNATTSYCATNGDKNGHNLCFANSIQYNRAIVLRQTANGKLNAQAHSYDERGRLDESPPDEFEVRGSHQRQAPGRETTMRRAFMNGDEKHMFAVMPGPDDDAGSGDAEGGITNIDLEHQQVVSTYRPNRGYPLQDVTQESKLNNDPNLLVGLAPNVAFMMDTRLDPRRCVVGTTDDYSITRRANDAFVCHATSGRGQLAIGSRNGEIRLYGGPPGAARSRPGRSDADDSHPKTAKTLLHAMPGHPIVSIDITVDGKFVVAATPSTVLLFPTEYTEQDNGKLLNGFDARMGKHKPTPLQLRVDPKMLAATQGDFTFDSVHFDKNDGNHDESWIVATAGAYIVSWGAVAAKAALQSSTSTEGSALGTEAALRNADAYGSVAGENDGLKDTVLYMTDQNVGIEHRAEQPSPPQGRRGKSYFTF